MNQLSNRWNERTLEMGNGNERMTCFVLQKRAKCCAQSPSEKHQLTEKEGKKKGEASRRPPFLRFAS
jgi:hypothetical protein